MSEKKPMASIHIKVGDIHLKVGIEDAKSIYDQLHNIFGLSDAGDPSLYHDNITQSYSSGFNWQWDYSNTLIPKWNRR